MILVQYYFYVGGFVLKQRRLGVALWVAAMAVTWGCMLNVGNTVKPLLTDDTAEEVPLSGGSSRVTATATPAPDPSATPSPEPGTSPTPATGALKGVIRNADGSIASRITVRAYASGSGSTSTGPVEVTTDDNGQFSFNSDLDGVFNLEAVKSDDFKAFRGQVAVKKGQVTGLDDIVLEPTGTITGRVTAPGLSTVTTFLGVDVFIPGSSYTAKTDQAGNFTLSSVAVGTFDLAAGHPDLGTANLGDVRVRPKETTKSGDLALSVATPRILAVVPGNAAPTMEVAISGESFGASRGGTLEVSFNGTIALDPVRPDDQTIRAKVPVGATSGNLIVKVSGILSNGRPFLVVKDLSLTQGDIELLLGRDATYSVRATDTGGQAVPNPSVGWKTAGSSVEAATTGDRAVLTAKAIGDSTLTASAGLLAKSAKVHVYRIDGVDLSSSSVTLNIPPPEGATPAPGFANSVLLTGTVRASDRAGRAVTWSTSRSDLITVTDGLIKTVSGAPGGTAIVTATSEDDPRRLATASVNVTTEGNLDLGVF